MSWEGLSDLSESPACEAARHAESVGSEAWAIKGCVQEVQFFSTTLRMERALEASATGPVQFTQGGVTGVVKDGEISNACVKLVLDTPEGERTVEALTRKSAVLGKATGVAFGIVGVAFSLWDLKNCYVDWSQEHVMAREFKTMVEMIDSLVGGYTKEQDSEPKTLLLQELQQLKEKAEVLKAEIDLHHSATEGSRAASNFVSLGSSGCTIAAPFTLGVTGIVAAVLSALSGLVSSGVTVGRSWQGYHYRQQLVELHDQSTAARIQYHKATTQRGLPRDPLLVERGLYKLTEPGHLKLYRSRIQNHRTTAQRGLPRHPLLAQPGMFKFTGPGHIQWYMSVTFTTYDGHTVGPRFSCDTDFWGSWYTGTIYVDPGATNILVQFSTRAGGDCHRVDRSDDSLPWITTGEGLRIPEVFYFERADGVKCFFQLAGHLSRPYVKSARLHLPYHPWVRDV